MKLTAKLSAAMGACIFVVLAIAEFLGARADVAAYERDVTRDHRVMGRAVAESIEHLAAREGPSRARELVAALNARDPQVTIVWDEASETPSVTSTRISLDDVPALVSRVPVHDRDGTPSTLVLTEPLHDEERVLFEAYARAVGTSLSLALVCTLVMLALGTALVGRPLQALGALAGRVGAGDLSVRASGGSDEVGALGRELNRMIEALTRTQARLDAESGARVQILEQLRHADRLRVVGEIASEIAHQIGTPLAAVRARAQLLSQDEIPADRVPSTGGRIVEDVDRVSGTVRRLLDFARRRTGKRERIDVARWADDTVDILRPLASKKSIALELSTGPGDVVLDAVEMQQALTNLVMNALQASAAGGRIEVSTALDDVSLRIDVVDHGSGIAPEALAHVFEPYFTTKDAGEGTGLGLSVAHGIVREHGGTIELESAVGEGTRVTVRLPRHAGSARSSPDGKASWTARPRSASPEAPPTPR